MFIIIVKGYICSFTVMTHQDVRCEQALLLVTFYSKKYEIRVHVALLMDCGVHGSGAVDCIVILTSTKEPRALFRETLLFFQSA